MQGALTGIDYTVLLLYLAATLALGLAIGRRVRTQHDYFLAGRRLPWWAIGMSLVATDIGGTDIIGVGGAAYSYGMAVGNFEWIGCVPAMIVAAFVFIPFFWRTGIYTIPEYLERRYNVSVRSALAACWLIFMACNLGVMLLASAKMMAVLFGWDPAVCIWITAAFVGIYTVAGGLAAVVYTDAIQCAVMVLGCLLVVVIGLEDVGGWSGLRGKIHAHEQQQAVATTGAASEEPAESTVAARLADPLHPDRVYHTKLILLPMDSPTPFPWTGIFFGLALVLSPAYWIGNQAIVQRSLGAKSEYAAKAAYVWGAVLKNTIPFIIAIPGLIAFAKYPNLPDGDQAFPRLVADILPIGCRGVFLAAFLAALMSSVDSYLNAASAIVTSDFYKRFVQPDATDQHLLRVGRWVTVALVLWAIAFAFYLTGRSEGIYTIFQTMMSFFQGPALAILLAGLLWRRATGKAALIGFLVGLACSISLFTLSQPAVTEALGWRPLFQIEEPFLYFSVWAFLATALTVAAVSLAMRPDPQAKLDYLVFASQRGASK
ncbi:MAG: sodium/solute symporter [Planctomycetes bacterium]|nr:sodium/solute symporter [Planctomycetota bacterium]